jgi:hypothetical protein
VLRKDLGARGTASCRVAQAEAEQSGVLALSGNGRVGNGFSGRGRRLDQMDKTEVLHIGRKAMVGSPPPWQRALMCRPDVERERG